MENVLLGGVVGFVLGLITGITISFKMLESIQNQLTEIEKDLEDLCSKS